MPDFAKILLILFVLNGLVFAQSLPELEKVKEIKLLESTRDDVRRILGEYFKKPDSDDTFETSNAEIEVSYSAGKCKIEDKEPEGWDVVEGKVAQIKITPKRKTLLKNLNLNLSKFKRENTYTNYNVPKAYHRKDLGILMITNEGEVREIFVEPSKKYYPLLCDKKLARRLLSTSSYFDPEIKERYYHFGDPNNFSDVLNLMLSLPEITANCSDYNGIKSCSDGVKVLSVFVYAKDPENDVMTFKYEVSGGKILPYDKKPIDMSEKVLWDLSGVNPGTYTITAAVDDGCGFCGIKQTRTVIVKECPDCKKP
jgi:hypothetical protein